MLSGSRECLPFGTVSYIAFIFGGIFMTEILELLIDICGSLHDITKDLREVKREVRDIKEQLNGGTPNSANSRRVSRP